MTADEFVNVLQRVHLSAPGAEQEPPHGACIAREASDGPRAADALEDLLLRFDCTSLAVGRVTFVSHPRPHFAGRVVGVFESEHIVLERSGAVSLFEHERFGERLLECAQDGAGFLRALAGFLSMVYERKRWLTRLDDAAEACATLAGGPRYAPFYTALCGYLDYGT